MQYDYQTISEPKMSNRKPATQKLKKTALPSPPKQDEALRSNSEFFNNSSLYTREILTIPAPHVTMRRKGNDFQNS